MKIDTTQVLKNLKGEDMVMLNSEIGDDGKQKIEKKPMILRELLNNLLNTEDQQNKLTAEKKGKAWQIMKKLWDKNGKKVELTADDRAFINERSKIFHPPMTYGILSEALVKKEKVDKKSDDKKRVKT
tara:strand:- start:659 stop:1042 length:384 start_codon:yes stop_codon:yes gene_type:complete